MRENVKSPGITRRREMLLLALAGALFEYPGASLERLAQVAGTSRRTLYRVANSREDLMAILERYALKAMYSVLDGIDFSSPNSTRILSELANGLLQYSEYCLFLYYGDFRADNPSSTHKIAFANYKQLLMDLFERAQKSGEVRTDMDPDWLFESYEHLLLAASAGILNGRMAKENAAELVCRSFFDGARAS